MLPPSIYELNFSNCDTVGVGTSRLSRSRNFATATCDRPTDRRREEVHLSAGRLWHTLSMSSFSQTVTAKQSGNYDRLRPRVSLCCNCGLVTVWLCVIYAFIFSNCDCLRSDIVTHYYRPTQCWHYGNTRTSERSALLETNCYDDALSMRSFSQTVTALRSDIVTHCYRPTQCSHYGNTALWLWLLQRRTGLRPDIVTHCYRATVGVGTSRLSRSRNFATATRDRPTEILSESNCRPGKPCISKNFSKFFYKSNFRPGKSGMSVNCKT